MADQKALEFLSKGVESWNAWRSDRNEGIFPADLAGAQLCELHLDRANFYRAQMQGAQLWMSDLRDVNFRLADLSGATFYEAALENSDLRRANLTSADFDSADLSGANLSGATLSGCNFSSAKLGRTVFANVDLSTAQGLDSAVHVGPSIIDFATIARSAGVINPAFLIDAGIPEAVITYAKALSGSGVQFYSCFISFSMKDQAFAERLHSDLRRRSIRCWFAPHDIQGGRKLHEQLDEAIRLHDKLLLILSPHSMESAWVKTEIANARERETRDKARVLFPISLTHFEAIRKWKCFDSDTGIDSAREIREYFIPDFSNWTDEAAYRKAFDRLVNDLQSSKDN